MRRPIMPLLLTTTLVLAACAGGEADPGPASPPGGAAPLEETTSSQESGEQQIAQHSLPTAEVFGEPAWGMQIPPSWEEMTPIVTGQHVIALSDATVVAYDTQGAEAWATDWTPLAEEDRVVGTPPVLRQVSPEVVAVIDTGKVEGEGLATTTYAALVTLISVEDGTLVKEVTVPGSESDAPQLGEIGLGFALPDRSAVVVTPEGEIVEAPAAPADARVVGVALSVRSDTTCRSALTPRAIDEMACRLVSTPGSPTWVGQARRLLASGTTHAARSWRSRNCCSGDKGANTCFSAARTAVLARQSTACPL